MTRSIARFLQGLWQGVRSTCPRCPSQPTHRWNASTIFLSKDWRRVCSLGLQGLITFFFLAREESLPFDEAGRDPHQQKKRKTHTSVVHFYRTFSCPSLQESTGQIMLKLNNTRIFMHVRQTERRFEHYLSCTFLKRRTWKRSKEMNNGILRLCVFRSLKTHTVFVSQASENFCGDRFGLHKKCPVCGRQGGRRQGW